MTGEVGVAVRAGNAAEKRHVWPRRAGQQHQHGGQRREQDAMQDAKKQHRDKCDRCSVEIQPAHSPHAKQRRKIQKPGDRGQHHRSQDRLWQVFQQPREEEQAQRQRDRGEDQRERRARACLVVHRRLRQAARHGISVAQRRREICRADAEKLLPRVEIISMLGREGAGGGNAFDIGEQQASGGERNNAFDVAQA